MHQPHQILINEKTGDVRINIEIPGIKDGGLEVKTKGRLVKVSAEKESLHADGFTVAKSTIHGRFEAGFILSQDLDPESISATYQKGILSLEMKPAEHRQPRTVPIKFQD